MHHHNSPPPFDLVQLSTLPEKDWHGRAVFHPWSQEGNTPYWLEEAGDPYDAHENPDGGASYDVGVVLRSYPDPDFPDDTRVEFVGDHGTVLVYAAWNLWTPRPASS